MINSFLPFCCPYCGEQPLKYKIIDESVDDVWIHKTNQKFSVLRDIWLEIECVCYKTGWYETLYYFFIGRLTRDMYMIIDHLEALETIIKDKRGY